MPDQSKMIGMASPGVVLCNDGVIESHIVLYLLIVAANFFISLGQEIMRESVLAVAFDNVLEAARGHLIVPDPHPPIVDKVDVQIHPIRFLGKSFGVKTRSADDVGAEFVFPDSH